jgi:hypothetical protein
MNKIGFARLATILFLVAIFLLTINTIADFDFGYHLKTGEYVLQTKAVPLYDIFSYTASAARWIAHYWLADVLFYVTYKFAGLIGLMIGVAAVAALTYLLVLRTAARKINSVFLPLLLIIPYSWLTFELWVVRPQIFTYFFTALLIFLLERWRAGGGAKNLYLVPFIFLAWANIHAGVIFGLFVIYLYAGAVFIENKFEFAKVKIIFATVFISTAAVFINPNTYRVLTYSEIIAPTVRALNTLEWRSLVDFLGTWQSWVFLALMIAATAFVFTRLVKNWRSFYEFEWAEAGLMAAAFILPLISIRHVGFFPILTFPLAISGLDELMRAKNFDFDGIRGMPTLAIIFAAALVTSAAVRLAEKPIINRQILPVGAADFIKLHNISGPMFNDASAGGYLIWRLWPAEKVFIDGRSDVYLGEPTTDYLAIMRASSGWEKLVNEKYKINYFLLWYREPLYSIVRNLFIKLVATMNFKLVYWDDAAIILLRDVPENRPIIEKYGYTIISPFLDIRAVPRNLRPVVIDEFERALKISPDSTALQNFLAH